MVVAEIIGFIISWLFFALGIHITAKLFGATKGFGNALIMALILAVIDIVIRIFLGLSWGWLSLVIMFLIMVIAFIQTYEFSAGKGFIAAIVCIIIIFLLLLLVAIIIVALAVVLVGLP